MIHNHDTIICIIRATTIINTVDGTNCGSPNAIVVTMSRPFADQSCTCALHFESYQNQHRYIVAKQMESKIPKRKQATDTSERTYLCNPVVDHHHKTATSYQNVL